jgi:hypothetical protein
MASCSYGNILRRTERSKVIGRLRPPRWSRRRPQTGAEIDTRGKFRIGSRSVSRPHSFVPDQPWNAALKDKPCDSSPSCNPCDSSESMTKAIRGKISNECECNVDSGQWFVKPLLALAGKLKNIELWVLYTWGVSIKVEWPGIRVGWRPGIETRFLFYNDGIPAIPESNSTTCTCGGEKP